ncbi:MAG: hypothetical protein ACREJC_12520 [Tepidisphaeraceae bacterium]
MSRRITIVSAGDEKYFRDLHGLVLSILEHRPSGADVSISVIDLGLSAMQLAELHNRGVTTAPGKWNFDFPQQAQTPRWYQAMSSRPFLPEYFPGFDVYVWIDADAWLQDWRAVELLCRGAVDVGLAIVPEVHAMYPYLWRQGEVPEFTFKCYRKTFGEEAANAMSGRPIINGGVFAMNAASPWWKLYAKWLVQGYNHSVHKWAEQCALNLACATSGEPFRVLPAWANWICLYAPPVFDPRRQLLCDPLPPFEPLSIIHLTGQRDPGLQIATTTGRLFPLPLDYFGFKSAASTLSVG